MIKYIIKRNDLTKLVHLGFLTLWFLDFHFSFGSINAKLFPWILTKNFIIIITFITSTWWLTSHLTINTVFTNLYTGYLSPVKRIKIILMFTRLSNVANPRRHYLLWKQFCRTIFFWGGGCCHSRLSQWIDDSLVGWLKLFCFYNTLPATAYQLFYTP